MHDIGGYLNLQDGVAPGYTESLRAGHWHILWKLFNMSNKDAAGYSSFMCHISHILASFHIFP